MAMITFTCPRCGDTWSEKYEDINKFDKRLSNYQITKYTKSEGRNYGRYEHVDLCPKCSALLELFLEGKLIFSDNTMKGDNL